MFLVFVSLGDLTLFLGDITKISGNMTQVLGDMTSGKMTLGRLDCKPTWAITDQKPNICFWINPQLFYELTRVVGWTLQDFVNHCLGSLFTNTVVSSLNILRCMWIVWMLIMVRWPSCYVVFLDMNYPSQLPTRNMILHLGQKLWKIPWLNLSIKLKGNITILLQYCMTFSLSSVRYIYLWLTFLVLCTMKYCIEYGDYGYLLDFLFFLWELSSMKIIWYN